MWKSIAIAVVVLIGGLLVYAATKPDVFKVQRSASIKAPPEKIFPLINDFRSWGQWSPYEKLDPDMKRQYSGPASGPGAVYAWQGDSNAGAGSITITQSTAPNRIAMNLDFTEPMQAHNQVEFTLVPQGEGTEVTWSMHGPAPYFAKVMHIIFNMDKMVGKDFESGLASLKAIAEK